MKLTAALVITLFCATMVGTAQPKGGFSGGFGAGWGWSSNASNYKQIIIGNPLLPFQDFSGFRIFVTQANLGYRTQRFLYSYTVKYSPGNSTISPYGIFYHGPSISFIPGKFKFNAGISWEKATARLGDIAEGQVTEFGIGYKFTRRSFIEFNLLYGDLEILELHPWARLYSNKEVAFYFTLNFYFSRFQD